MAVSVILCLRGEQAIKRILHSRLPERLAGRFPPAFVEIGIAVGLALLFTLARVPVDRFIGEHAPYAFVFLATVLACVLAGWRSGVVAMLAGQALAAYYFVSPVRNVAIAETQQIGALVVATVSESLIIVFIALYQREVKRAMAFRDRQMELLSEALREIDHRTRNNYQTVVALILLQAQRAEEPNVRKALAEAADRVRAVSLASDQLALRSEDLGNVRLGEHLKELCEQLKRGLAGEDVILSCDFADLTAPADTAIHLSIIVNELVTNALKHAFRRKRDERKEIRVSCAAAGEGIELVITDNGAGIDPKSKRVGLGSRLVQRFVKELKAEHKVTSSEAGTTHRIRLETFA